MLRDPKPRLDASARAAWRGCNARRGLRALAPAFTLALLVASAGGRAAGATEESPSTAPAPGGFGGLSFTSTDEPITVQADQLEFDYEKNRLVYQGAVHVVQGEFELESKMLIVTFDRADDLDKAELRRVVAQGEVVITQGERRATGDRAVFDQGSRQIVLVGNPVLRDGPNEVQGDRLTVYLDEGRSVIESSPKKRVSAVLYPGQGREGGRAEPREGPTPTAGPSPAGGPPEATP